VGEIRGLTVRQPWAGCIAWLDKRTENRTRRPPAKHVGTRIAIHAAAQVETGQVLDLPASASTGFASLFASSAQWDAWRFHRMGRPYNPADWPTKLARGAIVAVATLAGAHPWSWEELCGPTHLYTSPSTPGLCSPWVRLGVPWHWELADVRPLPIPIPCKGALGLWRVPENVAAAVVSQMRVRDTSATVTR
jgi:hypothetical protein